MHSEISSPDSGDDSLWCARIYLSKHVLANHCVFIQEPQYYDYCLLLGRKGML